MQHLSNANYITLAFENIHTHTHNDNAIIMFPSQYSNVCRMKIYTRAPPAPHHPLPIEAANSMSKYVVFKPKHGRNGKMSSRGEKKMSCINIANRDSSKFFLVVEHSSVNMDTFLRVCLAVSPCSALCLLFTCRGMLLSPRKKTSSQQTDPLLCQAVSVPRLDPGPPVLPWCDAGQESPSCPVSSPSPQFLKTFFRSRQFPALSEKQNKCCVYSFCFHK